MTDMDDFTFEVDDDALTSETGDAADAEIIGDFTDNGDGEGDSE